MTREVVGAEFARVLLLLSRGQSLSVRAVTVRFHGFV